MNRKIFYPIFCALIFSAIFYQTQAQAEKNSIKNNFFKKIESGKPKNPNQMIPLMT